MKLSHQLAAAKRKYERETAKKVADRQRAMAKQLMRAQLAQAVHG